VSLFQIQTFSVEGLVPSNQAVHAPLPTVNAMYHLKGSLKDEEHLKSAAFT
jgi:hypothetical protein